MPGEFVVVADAEQDIEHECEQGINDADENTNGKYSSTECDSNIHDFSSLWVYKIG